MGVIAGPGRGIADSEGKDGRCHPAHNLERRLVICQQKHEIERKTALVLIDYQTTILQTDSEMISLALYGIEEYSEVQYVQFQKPEVMILEKKNEFETSILNA